MLDTLKKVSLSVGATSTAFLASATAVAAQTSSLGNITVEGGYAQNIGGVFTAVLTFVMVLAALLVLGYLIWGGIEWITSGGDKGKTESARNKITAAVIGIIVLAAAYAIFLLIITFLGFGNVQELFNSLTPIDEAAGT